MDTNKRMVQITTGPYIGAVGYLEYDVDKHWVLNCRIDGTWHEFCSEQFEFKPYVIGRSI